MPAWLTEVLDLVCLLPVVAIALTLHHRFSDGRATEALVISQVLAVTYPVLGYLGVLSDAFCCVVAAVAVVLAVPQWRVAAVEVIALALALTLISPTWPVDSLIVMVTAVLATAWVRVLTDLDHRAADRSARAVVLAQDRERARITRDLHDSIGQELSALRLTLGMVEDHPALTGHDDAAVLLVVLGLAASQDFHVFLVSGACLTVLVGIFAVGIPTQVRLLRARRQLTALLR